MALTPEETEKLRIYLEVSANQILKGSGPLKILKIESTDTPGSRIQIDILCDPMELRDEDRIYECWLAICEVVTGVKGDSVQSRTPRIRDKDPETGKFIPVNNEIWGDYKRSHSSSRTIPGAKSFWMSFPIKIKENLLEKASKIQALSEKKQDKPPSDINTQKETILKKATALEKTLAAIHQQYEAIVLGKKNPDSKNEMAAPQQSKQDALVDMGRIVRDERDLLVRQCKELEDALQNSTLSDSKKMLRILIIIQKNVALAGKDVDVYSILNGGITALMDVLKSLNQANSASNIASAFSAPGVSSIATKAGDTVAASQRTNVTAGSTPAVKAGESAAPSYTGR